ncbi:MAG TPA: aspartate aminotransferase family protein [Terriglobia bacterium]|nr:aspartate aminotransferase family protein [Terriglobia bacterium]
MASQRPGSNSEELYRLASEITPGGVNSAQRNILPHLVIRQASGAVLTDADGREYLDYHAAFGPVLLGHNHPVVNRRVQEALESAVLSGVGATEVEIEVARKIHQHVPSAEKVLLCTTGSEATLHALRVARAFTGRPKIIKFQGCYHGVHDAVLCNIASPAEKVGELDPASAGILPDVLEHTLVSAFNDLDGVEKALDGHRGQVAAIIIEPIAHNVGCILPQPGFLEGLRQLATAHRTVLIFDEVITGFRHALGGYQSICGVTPDLTTLGKAIANGFPMAAVCGKAEIMDRFTTRPGGDTFFAGTYNGNGVGCAAALATLEMLEREPVHQHVFRLGERLRQGLREIHARLGVPATVAGFGSVFLTYFQEGPIVSYADLLRNDSQRFVDYRRRLIERGILKMPLNLKRNHVSYSHTDAHVDRTLEVCEDVLKEMLGSRPRAGSVVSTG